MRTSAVCSNAQSRVISTARGATPCPAASDRTQYPRLQRRFLVHLVEAALPEVLACWIEDRELVPPALVERLDLCPQPRLRFLQRVILMAPGHPLHQLGDRFGAPRRASPRVFHPARADDDVGDPGDGFRGEHAGE